MLRTRLNLSTPLLWIAGMAALIALAGFMFRTGELTISVSTHELAHDADALTVTVSRVGKSSGVATVDYETVDGSAVAGIDFTATRGSLRWDADDTGAKSFVVSIPEGGAGGKSFTVSLSNAVGATLGTPASAAVTTGGSEPQCSRSTADWTTSGTFESRRYGNYIVNNNNWGGTYNQQLWVNSASCWGVTTSATTERGTVTSYPSVTRGWSQNGGILQQLSSAGTVDWTIKSGMGIRVDRLTKSKMHWAFTAPTSTGSRWLGLIDIYFHRSPTPSYTEFPPVVDLMITQAMMDQALSGQTAQTSTYYALVAKSNRATTVTIAGVPYLVYIDDGHESSFHQPGGHTIHLFQRPTTLTDAIGPRWGSMNSRHDIKAIIDYFRQPSPKNDAGQGLVYANGTAVTTSLITNDLYLNAINAGWEIDIGTQFTNTAFCVSMQDEPDCV